MEIMMRYFDGEGAASPQGVVDYVGTHLQSPQEAGSLRAVRGYLSKEGRVEPLLCSATWKMVGWDGVGLPPEVLVRNLCQGRDLWGHRLTRTRNLYRAPKELVISLPSELSEALKGDPVAAHEIIITAIEAAVKSLEETSVRARSGKRPKDPSDWAPARLLFLGYPHAQNRAGEADLHAHVYIFPPALNSEGEWRTFDNFHHMALLSKPGGGRQRVTEAVIAEAERWGYNVEITRGKARGAGPQGARVVCPDGHIIERGSLPRTRRSEVLAAQEMVRECGAPPLTPKQVELVRRETGRFPVELKGVKRQDLLLRKLCALGFLDHEGRVLPSAKLTEACQAMETGMATAQVSLTDLPEMPHSLAAAEIIKSRRKALAVQVPELTLNTNQARIRWTATYDRVLELVAAAPEGLTTDELDKPTRDNLSKLKRAGVLLGEKVDKRLVYTLGPAGVERLARGRAEQVEAEALVTDIAGQAIQGAHSPGQIRGRLEMLGIQANPALERFELGAIGRVVEAPTLMARTGIRPETKPVPDIPWWERWWRQSQKLPELLRRAILHPAEVMKRWSKEWGQKAAKAVQAQAKVRKVAEAKAKKEADERLKIERSKEGGYTPPTNKARHTPPRNAVHQAPTQNSPGGKGHGRSIR